MSGFFEVIAEGGKYINKTHDRDRGEDVNTKPILPCNRNVLFDESFEYNKNLQIRILK